MSVMKHRPHQGGAWKVAYADFITAMMALFLVLWLTAQDAKIKKAVERAFRNPMSAVNKESTGIVPATEPSMQVKAQGKFDSANVVQLEMLRRITEDLAKMLKGQDESRETIKMELTSEGLRINIFDRTHKPIFETDSDKFTEYGSWVFTTLAWEISRYETFKIELEGHTEFKSQTGREARGKWELSVERANAARRQLVQGGVVPKQIFKVSGFGDGQPLPKQPAADETNRRVTVLLKYPQPGDESGSVEKLHAGNP
jgi:chemotaxis protein MotB